MKKDDKFLPFYGWRKCCNFRNLADRFQPRQKDPAYQRDGEVEYAKNGECRKMPEFFRSLDAHTARGNFTHRDTSRFDSDSSMRN